MKTIVGVQIFAAFIVVSATSADEPLTAESLAKSSGCLECHSVDEGIAGPAFRDVASFYAGNHDLNAREKLINTVKHGGKGNWTMLSGGAPMPGFSKRLSDGQIQRLVNWVLGGHELRVMKMGLGSGMISSTPSGIQCGDDCNENFAIDASVTLTATPAAGSVFVRWDGDGNGSTSNSITMAMDEDRSLRPVFHLEKQIPQIVDFSPEGIRDYLTNNPTVNTPARFIRALPDDFKQNWILMSRSESLQTGTAQHPRLLLPSRDAQFVFTTGIATSSSYPGSHPNAIEYMQWDGVEKNFRFHEIVLDNIPEMGNELELPNGSLKRVFGKRDRGISIDDSKCSKCHSTQNVLNRSSYPGTTGITPGLLKAKNKPNWDSYDSWGGMMPLNRDRIYKGTVEAAAFRRIFNPWTWRNDDAIRSVIEQLKLQPDGVRKEDVIERHSGGQYDGFVKFEFDRETFPVLVEPAPISLESVDTKYDFNAKVGTGAVSSVNRENVFVTLHHSDAVMSDEGRAVEFFDHLGGLNGTFNPQRIADELIDHQFATGSVPIDIRPVALAIVEGLFRIESSSVQSTPAHSIGNLSFFDARNDIGIDDLVTDTRSRAFSLPRRKADIQRMNLDRTDDVYLDKGEPMNGLIQEFGAATEQSTDTSFPRIRQEVFRRPIDDRSPDRTQLMGEFVDGTYEGIYVDREDKSNVETVALLRYFLEPLGVSVDSWSMCVRGRSRTYTFADVFRQYKNELRDKLEQSLREDPRGLGAFDPTDANELIAAVNRSLSSLPSANAVPSFTDIQRIFNRSCIECHGGLLYPPYSNFVGSPIAYHIDFSEDEDPPTTVPPLPSPRLFRSHQIADQLSNSDLSSSSLYVRVVNPKEDLLRYAEWEYEVMPCGGPPLSKVDIETIRRWTLGGSPGSSGSFHITTIDGIDYDFQAGGEFVLVRGETLEVQVRLTPVESIALPIPDAYTGLASRASVNSAVAVRVGTHRITYQPDPNVPERLQLRVDGELVVLTPSGIQLTSGGRIIQTSAPGGIQIEPPGGTVIVVTPGWWADSDQWYMHIDTRHVRSTQGLMGSIAPNNWLPAMPDGSLLGPRPGDAERRYAVLYEQFGNAWRVSETNSLFDYAPATSTEMFTIPLWPKAGESNKRALRPLSMDVARQYVRGILNRTHRHNAVRDVAVTGEPSFARTYLLAEQIRSNTVPSIPELVVPKKFESGLTEPVTFTWNRSSDPDEDPVTYRHYVWPVGEMPNNNRAIPVSTANAEIDLESISRSVSDLKPGSAYFWKVIADDGKGGTVESETRRLEIK